jgi:ABC-type antimicrobial peptide transport system permease subunit
MTKKILLLRLSYWIAALADIFVAIVTLIPKRMGLSEVAYPMGLASVIAFSWAVMLLMADRKPIERRWMLIPTILVVTLIASVRTVFTLNGTVEFSLMLLLFSIALIVLMMYSYWYAGKHSESG